MDPKSRRQSIIQVGACPRCLSTAHKVEGCGSLATGGVSQQRHHSLLHKGHWSGGNQTYFGGPRRRSCRTEPCLWANEE